MNEPKRNPYAADYNIVNDRLFLWCLPKDEQRLPEEDYKAIKEIPGMVWWHRGCFTCLWSPDAEDLILNRFGMDIEERDEADDVERRVGRFAKYAGNNQREAGSHSEYIASGRANTRRRIEGAERVMTRKAEAAAYWHERIARSIRHAEFKEQPSVIRNRIKRLEADLRRWGRELKTSVVFYTEWDKPNLTYKDAHTLAGHGGRTTDVSEDPRLNGGRSLWSALDDKKIDAATARDIIVPVYQAYIIKCTRWIEHINMRLEFERAYLGGDLAEPERVDELPFEKDKWFIQEGHAYRIIRVNTDDVAVAMDNRYGYFRISKYRIKQLFTYKQIVEMGTPLGSPLEDPKSALVFEVGKWAVVKGYAGGIIYYKILKIGRTQLDVQTDSVYRIAGKVKKLEVVEVITEEEKNKREAEAKAEAERQYRMRNRIGEYADDA